MVDKRSDRIHTNFQFYSNRCVRANDLKRKNDTNVHELTQFLDIQIIIGIYKLP